MCIFLLPSVGEGVPKGRMRGGLPLKQALVIPSPAGGRGPGRGWARFTSPPPGERPGAGGVFFSLNLCPLCVRHTVPLFSPRSLSNEWDSKQDKTRSFGPGERHGVRTRTNGHQENQRSSSAPIEIRPRHKKKDPSHFGRVVEDGDLG